MSIFHRNFFCEQILVNSPRIPKTNLILTQPIELRWWETHPQGSDINRISFWIEASHNRTWPLKWPIHSGATNKKSPSSFFRERWKFWSPTASLGRAGWIWNKKLVFDSRSLHIYFVCISCVCARAIKDLNYRPRAAAWWSARSLSPIDEEREKDGKTSKKLVSWTRNLLRAAERIPLDAFNCYHVA